MIDGPAAPATAGVAGLFFYLSAFVDGAHPINQLGDGAAAVSFTRRATYLHQFDKLSCAAVSYSMKVAGPANRLHNRPTSVCRIEAGCGGGYGAEVCPTVCRRSGLKPRSLDISKASNTQPVHNPAVKKRIPSPQAVWAVAKSGDRWVIEKADLQRCWPVGVPRPRCGKQLRKRGDSRVMTR